MRTHVAIVGGGVMGTSIAVSLARRCDPLARPVVLFERSELAAGSSGRSGAILRQHYAERGLAGMARDSLRTYASFEARTGRGIGYRRTGVLTLAGPDHPGAREAIETTAAMQRELGIEVELLDAAQMRRRVPGLEVAEGSLGAWEPDGGFVDARRTVQAFADVAREHGAATRLGVEVRTIRIEGGRAVGVETSEGLVEAEHVVVAAGPWTRALFAELRRELPLRIVQPGQAFFAMPRPSPAARFAQEAAPLPEEGPEAEFARRFLDRREPAPVAHPVLLDVDQGLYVRCEPDDSRTRVGKMDYHAEPVLDDPAGGRETISPEFRREAREGLERRVPEYAALPDAGELTGLYTCSPDANALIGAVPGVAGLWIASGFSGHGFKLAPSVGEGLAQMIAGEPVAAFDPRLFDPARFPADVEWGAAFGL